MHRGLITAVPKCLAQSSLIAFSLQFITGLTGAHWFGPMQWRDWQASVSTATRPAFHLIGHRRLPPPLPHHPPPLHLLLTGKGGSQAGNLSGLSMNCSAACSQAAARPASSDKRMAGSNGGGGGFFLTLGRMLNHSFPDCTSPPPSFFLLFSFLSGD